MTESMSMQNDIQLIKKTAPLIHNITNYVVMNTTANALLAIGASPIMAHAPEELPELLSYAGALVLNIGTLDTNWIAHFSLAAQIATKLSLPIVLDPVGAGATQLRTKTVLNLLNDHAITVLRGNASEIMALDQSHVKTKGVDSVNKSDDAIIAAKKLSEKFNCVVVVSGKTDYCVDREKIISVDRGSPMMTKVTGMGCVATAVIGAFVAVNKNFLQASSHAMMCVGMCGEIAAEKSAGPGTFFPNFLDALYST